MELKPPCTPGTTRPWKKAPAAGWLRTASGITRKLATMKTNMKRSHRRKLPVAVITTSATAAIGTETYSLTPKYAERQADADELGGDGEEVEEEQVADREGTPELAEPLVDQPGVPDAGDRTEADHHLLVDDEHRDEQRQASTAG